MVEIFAIVFPLLGLGLGAFFGYKSYGLKNIKKLIVALPTTKINLIKPGLVEISGEAHKADNSVKSPFNGKECFYYKYNIEEKHTKREKNGHTSTSWKTIRSGAQSTPFYVNDGSGKVLVDPKEADISISIDEEANSSLGKDPPEHIKEFLKSNNISFEGFLGINKTMRYQEHIICPKEKLFIIGTACEDKEGYTIKKGLQERFYLISDSEEKEILKSYGNKILGNNIAAIICAVIGILFFLFVTVRSF
jgi:hypothetical protein